MKKKRLFNFLFIFISIVNLLCIVAFTVNIGISLDKKTDNSVISFDDDMTVLLHDKYELKQGDFVKKNKLSSNLILSNDAFYQISNLDSVDIEVGDVFIKNQVLGSFNGNSVFADDSGVVVDVVDDSLTSTVFLYYFNRFYIEVSVDAETYYSFDFEKDSFYSIINGQTKRMSVIGFDLSKVGNYGTFIIKYSIEKTDSIIIPSSLQGTYKKIADYTNVSFLPLGAFKSIGTTKEFSYISNNEIKTVLITCIDIIDGYCLVECFDTDLTQIDFLYGK